MIYGCGLIITRPQSDIIPGHYITKVKALSRSHMLLRINVSLSPGHWSQRSLSSVSPGPGVSTAQCRLLTSPSALCARLTTLRACTRPIPAAGPNLCGARI